MSAVSAVRPAGPVVHQLDVRETAPSLVERAKVLVSTAWLTIARTRLSAASSLESVRAHIELHPHAVRDGVHEVRRRLRSRSRCLRPRRRLDLVSSTTACDIAPSD